MKAYERTILEETNGKPSIIITSNGIPLYNTIDTILSLYSDEYSLTIVVNMNKYDKERYQNVQDITNITNRTINTYLSHNLITASSTCLVTDIVNNILPIEKVSTLIILNGEKIKPNSNEAFIAYLFNERNSLKLIRVFINEIYIKDVEELRTIFCCNKFLFYPIFHEAVKKSKISHEMSVIDIKTPTFILEISTLILDLLKSMKIDYLNAFLNPFIDENSYNFKWLMIFLHNIDAFTLLRIYNSMIDKQKELGIVDSWIYSDKAFLLLKKLEEYRDSILEVTDTISATLNLNSDYVFEINEIPTNETILFDINYVIKIPKVKSLLKLINKFKEDKLKIIVQNTSIKIMIVQFLSYYKYEHYEIFTHEDFKNKTEGQKDEVLIFFNYNLGSLRHTEFIYPEGVKIFILNYRESVEEEIYLKSISREDDLFEKMIEDRGKMCLVTEFYTNTNLDIEEDVSIDIMIDSREMRSKLPFSLYRTKSFNLEIKVLKTGDYILKDNFVMIERKTLQDFKGSLKSGRLYSQATRYFSYLLIEFEDQTFPSILNPFYIKLLCIFINHFDTTRILWSNNSKYTCELFYKVYKLKPLAFEEEYDSVLFNLLLDIPGVNIECAKKIMREFVSIRELAEAPIDQLSKIIEEPRARQIFCFFREKL
ncbi:XPF [Hepatospora eriocheir]|uniref:XPF n=1 Tax=Hepatospora eriocheir TaxID=1081669 RepID=A0A1X0QI67_9MICR|nr:XPF [Hepatospora eriocheir]